MAMLNFLQLRFNLHAMFRAVFTAASEGASGWQIQRTGDFAFQRLNFFAGFEIYLKNCAHKSLGIRMLAAFSNASMFQPFYNITQIHNCHLMAHQVNKS